MRLANIRMTNERYMYLLIHALKYTYAGYCERKSESLFLDKLLLSWKEK